MHKPSTPVLQIHDLHVSLPPGADRPHAVAGIGFELHAGRTVCLVGESGSGKSVIAQTIMGLAPPALRATQGQVLLQGEDVLQAGPARLRQLRGTAMAMVFQEPMTALNPVMRCGTQVDEMLRQHSTMGTAERRREVLRIFEQVRLPDPERIFAAYPHQLSGGQRQRVVIAIALVLRPALLICDEPTTALDVTTQAGILALIGDLQREHGTAVLFITHDFGVVADIADEVVVLQLGQPVEQGPRDAVLQNPQAAYTRMLLAAVPTMAPGRRRRPQPGPVLLRAQGLGKTYAAGSWFARRRSVHAAQDVDLSLHPGETVGIVGESGSGKSTVARCIARLISPTQGSVQTEATASAPTSRAERSAFRRLVQVVFQDPYRSLNPRQTVGQSIIEGPLNFGMPREAAWARAEELMRLVRLRPDALRRYPGEFSGGQRQRICIARALACEPQVLIADEAVSALDVSVQAQVLDLLDDIQRQLGIAILFITHDLRVASQICDRVLVMQRGRVVEQGTAQQIFLEPAHEYTRTLLAAAPGQGYRFAQAAP